MKKLKLGKLYNKDPDEHIKILVKRCNQLQELCLKYYRYITNIGITSVIEELKNTLETLDLYPCKNISHSQLLKLKEMPKLKSLSTRNKWLRIGRTLNAYEGFGFVVLWENILSQIDGATDVMTKLWTLGGTKKLENWFTLKFILM